MKYISRSVEKLIKEMEKQFYVILISGARQVGKSTLLNNYLKEKTDIKINYITFDDMKLRLQAQEDPELFISTLETPVIIDEFQYAPDILSYIKIKVDKQKLEDLHSNKEKVYKTMYYLTGSQVFQTMKNISESLAGRIGLIDLYGFSTCEIEGRNEEPFIPEFSILKEKENIINDNNNININKNINELYKRIFKGSFPEIYVEKKDRVQLEQFYSSYIRTYIERDVRDLINIKDENKFIKFISSIAARTAQEYNANDIGRDVGIDSKTVDSWLSILKNTGLVYLLQPYYSNVVSRIIKRPKIYFMDTGLASYLAGYLTSDTLQKSIYSGAIFETYIISEIIKSYANNGLDPRRYLYYYRDSNQKEIDILIVYDNNIYPIEIKKGTNLSKSAGKNFDLVNQFELNVKDGTILCLSDRLMKLTKNINIVPISYI